MVMSEKAKKAIERKRAWYFDPVNFLSKQHVEHYFTGDGWAYGFFETDNDAAVATFSKFRPCSKGRPRNFYHALLQASAGVSASNRVVYQMHSSGLVYTHPPVIGRRRLMYYTSIAGYAVLEDAAARSKQFAKFYAAYVRKKDRNRALEECGLLRNDVLPDAIKNGLIAYRNSVEALSVSPFQISLAEADGATK